MGIEPSGSDFLDYMMPKLITAAIVIMMFVIAVVEIRDGYLGIGLVLMAMFLFLVGFLLLALSPSPRDGYVTSPLVTIGGMALGASAVALLFGLWFLKNPPVGIP